MFRRLCLIVAAVNIGALCWFASTASAFQGDPMTTPENQSLLKALFQDPSTVLSTPSGTNPATGSAYTAAETEGGFLEAAGAAGSVATLAELGTVVLVGGYTGWTIGTADFNAGKTIYEQITGDSSVTPGTIIPYWKSYCATNQSGPNAKGCNSVSFSGGGFPASTSISPSGLWSLNVKTTSGTFDTDLICTTLGLSLGHSCTASNSTETAVAYQILGLSDRAQEQDNTGTTTACPAIGDCMRVWSTFGQMNKAARITPTTKATAQATGTGIQTVTTTTPPNAVTDTTVNNAERSCGGFLGSATGTATQEACRAAVNLYVDPTWDRASPTAPAGGTTSVVSGGTGGGSSFQPFVLPKPDVNETYQDYLDRLRALGWVGTATITTAGSPLAGIGAKAVIDVQDPDATDTSTVSTLTWPDNPPTVGGSGDAINIDRNPNTAPAVVVPPPISGGGCSCPPIDMSPLESVPVGSKFPFGAFTWFANELGTIPTTGTPIDISIPYPSGISGGPVDFNMQSNDWETTYRPILFPIIEIFMTLAMFYGFATRVLGIGDAGQIDD